MAFEVRFNEGAVEDLLAIRVHQRRRITAEIDRLLRQQPDVATRRRKMLGDVSADFVYDPPLWELRIQDYRAFYTILGADQTVVIQAVRRKRPDQTTEDVLHEDDDR